MEDQALEVIRETSRNVLVYNRRKQKDEQTDLRRSLPNSRLFPCDLTQIVNKLKTKGSILASELKLVQNALVDDPKNVQILLNTHGALRRLVKELTGHDVNKQIAACDCLCNLALGDSKACGTIAKAAGAYLVAALDTLNTHLAVSCAWTLGNLAGSGSKACQLIIPQGALTKFCDVLQGTNKDVQEATLYALTHIAFVMKDDLSSEHLNKIIESLSKTEINVDSSKLLFIISCHGAFTPEILPEEYLLRIIEKLKLSIEHHLTICKSNNKMEDDAAFANVNIDNGSSVNNNCQKSSIDNKCCELVYLLRTLANMNSIEVYNAIISYFTSNNIENYFVKLMLVDPDKSLYWFLGNMMKYCSDNVSFFGLFGPCLSV